WYLSFSYAIYIVASLFCFFSPRLSIPFLLFSIKYSAHPRNLHSFPTRRSSDLERRTLPAPTECRNGVGAGRQARPPAFLSPAARDLKSTRLNSSHDQISYAVFCLKKKNEKPQNETTLRRHFAAMRSAIDRSK